VSDPRGSDGVKRLRVSIPAADLSVQPAITDLTGYAAPALGEFVAELVPTRDDRAAGRRRFEVVVDGWRFEATTEPADRAALRERALRAAAEHHPAAETTLRAQIPGRIVRVWVAEGEQVEQGQRLLAIEAMKMENEIRAPRSGTVQHLKVELGARVERDSELLTIT
jgi:biotin carboxyl carrier protein